MMHLKKIIVKFGTESLMSVKGRLSQRIFNEAARQIAELRANGTKVVIVSSGAVQAGREVATQLKIDTSKLHKKDLAGIGSAKLMSMWAIAFGRQGLAVAQVWVTHANLEDPKERASITFSNINYLESGIVPIVNENDVVSAREIDLMEQRISENDQLTRLIAEFTHPNGILSITSVGGVYERDPHTDLSARKFAELNIGSLPQGITQSGSKSSFGNGGMDKKISELAKCCVRGRRVVIGSIENDGIIRFAERRPVGTLLGQANRF